MDTMVEKRAGNELYMRAYMDGYTAGLERARGEVKKSYLTVDDIAVRYNVGKSKANEIMRAVRHCCNGGKLDHDGRILLSELEYWESIPETQFKARL